MTAAPGFFRLGKKRATVCRYSSADEQCQGLERPKNTSMVNRVIPAMSSQRTDVAVSSPGYATRYGAGPVRQHGRTPLVPLCRVELDGKRPARIRSQVVASAAHFADFLVVAIAGAASVALQPGFSWPLPPLPALTAALVLPMMTRRRNPNASQAEEFTQQGFSRHFGDGAAYALSAFGFALVTALAVLQPDPAERGPLVALLLFWAVASLAGITAVRAVLSVLQARWRAAGRLKQLVAGLPHRRPRRAPIGAACRLHRVDRDRRRVR
jgi:hypothetical protein